MVKPQHALEARPARGQEQPLLKVLRKINKSDIIVIGQTNPYVPSAELLIAHFDGSCKCKDKTPHCREGIVIYIANDDQILAEILTIVVHLPNAYNYLEAEAIGAARASSELLSLLQQDQYKGYAPTTRADSNPVNGINGSTTRLCRRAMLDIFQPTMKVGHNANIPIEWQHIPRAYSPVANKLANEGSDSVPDGAYTSRINIDGNIIRPGSG